jgi:hypothetical protein
MNVVKAMSYSLMLKLVIGTFLAIIAGPGFLGFLSQYATHWYALSNDIRPPVEGVPYLNSVVAIGSLFLAASAFLVFLLTRLFLAVVVGLMLRILDMSAETSDDATRIFAPAGAATSFKGNLEELPKMTGKKAIMTITFFSFAIGFTFMVYDFFEGDSYQPKMWLFMIVWAWFSLYTVWRKTVIWWIGIGTAVCVYTVTILLMFNLNFYEKLIVELKYGGRMPIVIDYKDKTKGKSEESLILRTNESLIISDGEKGSVEVFIREVASIRYLGDE